MNVHAEGFAGGDRTRIDLPAPQEELLEQVNAIGKPTVLVLMNGSALAVNWAMAGDEVVHLYLTHGGVVGAPLRALAGFRRVHLDRGQKETVSFTLRDRDLSVVDESGKRRIIPGTVQAWVGGGQPISRSGL